MNLKQFLQEGSDSRKGETMKHVETACENPIPVNLENDPPHIYCDKTGKFQ